MENTSADCEPISGNGADPTSRQSAPSGELPVRGRWLVFTSLILAMLIEVCPFEVDFIYIALTEKNVLLFLAVKTIFLSLILGPLMLFLRMNGRRGAEAVQGRIIAIGVIVVVKLALDAYCVVGTFLHGN